MSGFEQLDPLLHSQLRLAVMSLLIGVDAAEFVFIKEKTGATAGNLSVQLDKLSNAGYISVTKSFKGKKPVTSCSNTKVGIRAFEAIFFLATFMLSRASCFVAFIENQPFPLKVFERDTFLTIWKCLGT